MQTAPVPKCAYRHLHYLTVSNELSLHKKQITRIQPVFKN